MMTALSLLGGSSLVGGVSGSSGTGSGCAPADKRCLAAKVGQGQSPWQGAADWPATLHTVESMCAGGL